MKDRNLILVLVLMLLSLLIQAQPNQDGKNRSERIESMRVAFITQRLTLTAAEAQKFWPVYNSYRSDVKTLRRNFKQTEEDGTPLTADERLEYDQKKLDLKKSYKPQLEAAIGKEKMNLLMTAEEDFKKELMQIMREKRDGPRRF